MRLALLWFVGLSARATLLAVPPLIPAMHRDLPLDETAVGLLGGLPVLLLSAGSVLGSLLIARVGARRAAIVGLATVGLASALRGVGPSVPTLFAMTFVMSAGVSLTQLAIPSLVAAWMAHDVGRATAAYGNGMLVGEIAGAGLTATALLPLAAGSWELALAAWSVPVLLAGVALLFQPDAAPSREPVRWWPEWRDRRVWTLGLTLGAASLAYWGANAHLPDYLHATGHADDVPAALASLNGVQLPSSVLLGAWPAAFLARRWPFVASGLVTVACAAGLAVMAGAASVVWAGALGLVAALVFLLGLALPPVLVPRGDVHRFSAGVFTVSYAFAFVGPLVAGALWDATGIPAVALAPIAVAGVLMVVLGTRVALR